MKALLTSALMASLTCAQVGALAQVKGSIIPAVTTTDLTLLVNAGTLGSQPTQSQKNSGSYSYLSEGITSPGASMAGSSQKKAGDLSPSSVDKIIGIQNSYVKTKPGKYGIVFDANVVRDLYQKRILNNLDNFIEAASLNLDITNNATITDLILSNLYDKLSQKYQEAGTFDAMMNKCGNNLPTCFKNYFDPRVRKALNQLNYKDIVLTNSLDVLNELINQAGVAQVSFGYDAGGDVFQNYATSLTSSTKYAPASIDAAIFLAYLFSYDSVWKQNDATYKALYDNYVTRQKGNKLGTYQFASARHGALVSFKRYGVQFGAFSWIIANSNDPQVSTSLWDGPCNCPAADLFTSWSSSTQSSFIIP